MCCLGAIFHAWFTVSKKLNLAKKILLKCSKFPNSPIPTVHTVLHALCSCRAVILRRTAGPDAVRELRLPPRLQRYLLHEEDIWGPPSSNCTLVTMTSCSGPHNSHAHFPYCQMSPLVKMALGSLDLIPEQQMPYKGYQCICNSIEPSCSIKTMESFRISNPSS